MRTLAKPRDVAWFDFLTALAVGVLGPALAIVAIVLAAANKRLATIIWVLALVVYIAPLGAFAIGMAIYGF